MPGGNYSKTTTNTTKPGGPQAGKYTNKGIQQMNIGGYGSRTRVDIWSSLDEGQRHILNSSIIKDTEREYLGKERGAELIHLLLWVVFGVCGGLISGSAGVWLYCGALVGLHFSRIVNPSLPYLQRFEASDKKWASRREVRKTITTLRPRFEDVSNKKCLQEAVQGLDMGNLPARSIISSDAHYFGLRDWLDNKCGSGACSMAEVLLRQERYETANLRDLASVITRVGGTNP